MRFFRDLRVMIMSIMSSLRMLIWASVLLVMIMCMFAIFLMQSIMMSNRHIPNTGAAEDKLLEHFGGVVQSIFTLYKSICGGVDWGDVAEHLDGISPYLVVFFSVYIAFAVICVLNIITGVFVENATQLTTK